MSQEKICYVIMPYGGDDEEKKKRYNSIFKAIISPAAMQKGYRCVREDHESRQGSITKNIIQSLGEADIVIADLSDNNWNVAYELGMRHALCKSGTILIIDDQTKIMFDIQSNKLIKYPVEWHTNFIETQQEIINAIEYFEANKTVTDSPVHDVFPALPFHVTEELGTSRGIAEQASGEGNARLETLLGSLESLLTGSGASGTSAASGAAGNDTAEAVDVSGNLMSALDKSQYSGKNAISKLQKALNEGNEAEFVNFLGTILSKGALTEKDFNSIYFMCTKLGNNDVTTVFLEEAIKRFPESTDFIGRLARMYSKSADKKDKAIEAVNKLVGVKKSGTIYVIERKELTYNCLGAFFDVYLELGMFQDILDVCPPLLAKQPTHASIIRRNTVTALRRLKRYAEAEKAAFQLVHDEPNDDRNRYAMYLCYYYLDKYFEAYAEIEKCISLKPDDSDYHMIIASYIKDIGITRISDGRGGSKISKVTPAQADRALVPFIFRLYSLENYRAKECADFLQRNKLADALEIFKKYHSDRASSIPKLPQFDYTALDYCLK